MDSSNRQATGLFRSWMRPVSCCSMDLDGLSGLASSRLPQRETHASVLMTSLGKSGMHNETCAGADGGVYLGLSAAYGTILKAL